MRHHHSDTPPPYSTSFWGQVHGQLFETSHTHGWAHQVNRWIAWLIMLSTLALALEHNPVLASQYASTFYWVDVLTVGVFTLEFLLRLGAAGADPRWQGQRWPRWRWLRSPSALIDLLAIAPFYLAPWLPMNADAARLLRLARLVRILKLGRSLAEAWHEFQRLNRHRNLRAKVYAALEVTGHSGRLHHYVDNFIVFWVLLSVASVVLESVASVRAVVGREIEVIDTIAFGIFTVEYLARWYAAPENPAHHGRWLPRWAFMRSPQAIIDLLAILPFLLERFLPWPMDLRFLRVFRLLRLLKLTRYTSATGTLYKVVKREWQVILASVFVMLLLVLLTASMGYLFEHQAQPDKFENIPQSIYWAVVTLASVGYGDISPVTPMGRALTVVLSLLGIGIFAIPAGLLASAFTDQLRIDRETLRDKLRHAMTKGHLDPTAKEWLAAETERLHLSPDDVQRLLAEAQASQLADTPAPVVATLIDPQRHPDLAGGQFRLLVDQLLLLRQATDEAALRQQLAQHPQAQRVLQALANEPVAQR
jgi:voltage-gated potassium channel